MNERELLTQVLHRPVAYGIRTPEQASSFLFGFDVALEFRALRGFGAWLAKELNGGWNLGWPALAHDLAVRRQKEQGRSMGDLRPEERLRALFELVQEFLEEREGRSH